MIIYLWCKISLTNTRLVFAIQYVFNTKAIGRKPGSPHYAPGHSKRTVKLTFHGPFDGLIWRPLFGPSGESRTHGLLNPIQARYQTALHPVTPGRQSAYIIIPARIAFVKREAPVFACFFTKSPRQRGCGGACAWVRQKKLHLQHGPQGEASYRECPLATIQTQQKIN